MTQDALREDREGVAIVTLNRPGKLNALNMAMRQVIFDAVDDLRDNDDLRVLLIQAKGRYFTAGVDIAREGPSGETPVAAGQSGIKTRRDYRAMHRYLDEMEAVEKPIVMAIQGPCLGLGVEMAGAVDFRLASESAAFGLPEIRIGVVAGSGGISRFTRLCGVGWSKWLNMAGETLDARTALIAGFVQAVYPDDVFEEKVWDFCRRLTTLPAEVQGAAKLAIELCKDLDRQQGRNVERLVNTPFLMSDRSDLVRSRLRRDKPED